MEISLLPWTTMGRLLSLWGADGHQHDGVQAGLQQRPATGQRIGGGASGRGYDNTVRSLGIHELAIDGSFKLNHAGDIPLVQHHIIERQQLTIGADISL